MQKSTFLTKLPARFAPKNLDNETNFDGNASKECSSQETNKQKLSKQISTIPKKQLISRLELVSIDQGQNMTEQDSMIEHYNRIDVHDLDKWLDAGKSRLSNNGEKKLKNVFYFISLMLM